MRPRNSALTTISERTPPIARSSSSAAPESRWPVAMGMAMASTLISAGLAATRVIFTASVKVSGQAYSSSQMFSHQLEHMRNAEVHPPAPGRGLDVHEAARVVGCQHRAAGFGDRVELPPGEAVRDTWPLEAERATEAAAVGDVGQVHHLVPGEFEHPARLALQPELAQRLAGVVV